MTQPIYQVIIDKLKDQIQTMDPNVPIQSERELSQVFNASRMTVRKAVQILVDEGYLYRDGNLGTFVADQKLRKDSSQKQPKQFFELAKEYRIIYFDVKTGGDSITHKLEIGALDQYIRIVRLNLIEAEPESIDEIYIAKKYIAPKDLTNIEKIFEFSASSATGSLKQEFIPMAVPINYANLLKLSINTPIIKVESTVYTQSGYVLAWINSFMNPKISSLKFVF